MTDYQQKRMGEYTLPQAVYRQALWAVKDIDRLKDRLREVHEKAGDIPSPDINYIHDGANSASLSDKTADFATEAMHIADRIEAIEGAFEVVPEKYRKGIKNYVVYGKPYSDIPCKNTWRKWQQVYIHQVAVNLGIL